MVLNNMAKAASGFLLRSGCAARLLAAGTMAAAAWAQAACLWAQALAHHEGDRLGDIGWPHLLVVWHIATVWASVVAAFPDFGEAVGWRRRLAGRVPFVLWACLTRDGRVTAWRSLVWILLWPAELLVCLWVACWWFGAAMDFTLYRRGGGP